MKPPSKEVSLFLELLSASIWQQKPDTSLFKETDEATWKSVVQYARKQSVPALIADGMGMLPSDLQPPRTIRLSLALAADKTEQLNLLLNNTLAKVSADYLAAGFPFILLKGQGNARYYPNPLHRNPGDLDLFLYRPGDYERANRWITALDYRLEEASRTHRSYDRDKVHIENHHNILYFELPKHNRLLAQELGKIIRSQQFETITIADAAIKVFPADFNLLYIFMHLFHHFVYGGIGLRQICDWLLMLSALQGKIERRTFLIQAEQFGLLYPMQIFAHLTIRYLKADPRLFPFEIGEPGRFPEKVMQDILHGGNFGHHHSNPDRRTTWGGRWKRYKIAVARSLTFGSMAPGHFFPIIFSMLFRRIRITLQPLFKGKGG